MRWKQWTEESKLKARNRFANGIVLVVRARLANAKDDPQGGQNIAQKGMDVSPKFPSDTSGVAL